MNVVWIVLGVTVVGIAMAMFGRSHGRGLSELGSVSDQWIAEHRSQTRNPPR